MGHDDGPAAVVATNGQRSATGERVPNGRPSDGVQLPRQRPETMPIPPRHFVPRERLWARLDESTRMGVTTLTGPVGSGKTLGIAGWLRARGHDRRNALWIHAD